MAHLPESVTIDVRINASDLEALRALAERCECAAARAEAAAASLREPTLRPSMQAEQTFGVCRACEAKDRAFADEHAARKKLLDEKHFNLIEVKKERETLAASLEDERTSHERTKFELDAWRKDHARREQECEALKKVNDNALAELRRMRGVLERESAKHFATRERLRDVLREAAAYAKEAGDYAADYSQSEYARVAREDAAQYEAESAALGVEVSGGTEAPNDLGASKLRVREITPDASTASEMARLLDEQVMGYAESKCEPAPAPAQPDPAATFRRRFLAGDRVRPAAQDAVYSAVLDEDDSGNVAIQIGSRRYVNIGADALELVKPADPAKRNLELAFHFHLWHTSVEPNIMDSVPEFARIAAQQLLRDPWNECVVKDSDAVPYGQVRVTGGAK